MFGDAGGDSNLISLTYNAWRWLSMITVVLLSAYAIGIRPKILSDPIVGSFTPMFFVGFYGIKILVDFWRAGK